VFNKRERELLFDGLKRDTKERRTVHERERDILYLTLSNPVFLVFI